MLVDGLVLTPGKHADERREQIQAVVPRDEAVDELAQHGEDHALEYERGDVHCDEEYRQDDDAARELGAERRYAEEGRHHEAHAAEHGERRGEDRFELGGAHREAAERRQEVHREYRDKPGEGDGAEDAPAPYGQRAVCGGGALEVQVAVDGHGRGAADDGRGDKAEAPQELHRDELRRPRRVHSGGRSAEPAGQPHGSASARTKA